MCSICDREQLQDQRDLELEIDFSSITVDPEVSCDCDLCKAEGACNSGYRKNSYTDNWESLPGWMKVGQAREDKSTVVPVNPSLKLLGDGVARMVYELPPNKVMKVAKREKSKNSNLNEWKIWNAVRGTEVEKYFVPVLYCAEDGSTLIMQRAANTAEQVYTWMPNDVENLLYRIGIADIHGGNYTPNFNGFPAMIDYGFVRADEFNTWLTSIGKEPVDLFGEFDF